MPTGHTSFGSNTDPSALQAEVVKLRYFVGMTKAETAQALGLSERTVKNCWTHARARLFREINSVQGVSPA